MKEIDRTSYESIEKPYVTVVVPFYNEEGCIGKCILSLLNQDFKPLEILVVDDGSIDDSAKICEHLGISVLRQHHRGPGVARNLGARNAKGNILVLIDADMVFAPDYVSKLVAPIITGEAIATCHWNEMVSNWDNPWARCQTWFLGRPDKRREPLEIPDDLYVYRGVQKEFFLESGGFAEDEGRGDDTSIARRTGIFSTAVPDAVCYHRNVESLNEVFLEALWDGRHVVATKGRRLRWYVATIIYRNPFIAILRGIYLSIVKKEPRMVLYSAVFSVGVTIGIIHALYSGYYLK